MFDVAVALKGIDGALEVIGGLVLSMVQPRTLATLVRFLTAHELSEDPSDLVANLLRSGVRHLSHDTRPFAAAYLLVHGLAKVLLVTGLLRGKRWAYPTALWFLGCFVVYQGYRLLLQHSLALAALTVFDLCVMFLIWREYREWGPSRSARVPGK